MNPPHVTGIMSRASELSSPVLCAYRQVSARYAIELNKTDASNRINTPRLAESSLATDKDLKSMHRLLFTHVARGLTWRFKLG